MLAVSDMGHLGHDGEISEINKKRELIIIFILLDLFWIVTFKGTCRFPDLKGPYQKIKLK